MAVVSFELVDADGDGDNNSQRGYKTLWHALTDDKNDHALTVLSSPLMPARPNSPYAIGNEIDLLAYAYKARAKRKKYKAHRTLWNVWIDFTTKPSRESNDDASFSDPLQKPITFNGEFTDRMVRITRDINGAEVRNSAGDVLPLETEGAFYRMQITKNLAEYDVPLWRMYAKKAANSDMFWGAEQGTCYCAGIRPTIEFWKGGTPYYPTTFDFLFLNPTDDMESFHEVQLRDQGPRYWSGGVVNGVGQGSKVNFRDDDGSQFVDGTGDLDGAGGKLAANADPKYKTFRVKYLIPFASLGLPTSNPYATT